MVLTFETDGKWNEDIRLIGRSICLRGFANVEKQTSYNIKSLLFSFTPSTNIDQSTSNEQLKYRT